MKKPQGPRCRSPSSLLDHVLCCVRAPLRQEHFLHPTSSKDRGLQQTVVVVVALIVTAVVAAAVGFVGGILVSRAAAPHPHTKSATPFQLVVHDVQPTYPYTVLSSTVWPRTAWGRNCSAARSSTTQKALCQLPTVWRNCTQGIYLDIGTNVGVQLRKLYDPWQFPGAPVLSVFAGTYGYNRGAVCSLGIEANPAHTPYLTVLNAYFKRKGYQAVVLTDTAASTSMGEAVFYPDPAQTHEWGASLGTARWKINQEAGTTALRVPLIDLPAFIAEVVKPIALQIEWATGRRPPIGMKMDVEGEEYAILPALITSGGLCDLDMIYLEPHRKTFRSETGKAVGMTIAAVEKAFAKLRKANPRCKVQYSHLDDETYLHGDTEVPLPP